ncbi:MAG: response regulator [Spirochaetales bacterium]|nr:response regulator [Spirochaetales bacterium]
MAIDKKSFIDNYVSESRENLTALSDIIIALRKTPEDRENLAELLRLLHTLKGAARMMDYKKIESISHELENLFKGVREKKVPLGNSLFQLVLSAVGYMEEGLKKVKVSGTDDIQIKKLRELFRKAESGQNYSIEDLEDDFKSPADRTSGSFSEEESDDTGGLGDYETIRIKVSKIDDIVKKLNGVIIQQFQFKRENENLALLEEGLRDSLRRLRNLPGKAETEGVIKNLSKDLKLTQDIRKTYIDEMVQLEHMSFELQEDILSLQMLPLNIVMDPLKKMVEEISLLIGKEVEFKIIGSNILLDKAILEHINDPVIHLIRNAIDHGLETPEVRKSAGKPPRGNLTVRCIAESGRVNIQISDDGKGLDYDAIRQKAISLYPEMEEEIQKMDRGALSSYLFQSGFTTTQKVTSLSGRGVGLDIVRTNVEKTKGKITVKSEPGKGTDFELSLPLSLATVDGFFVSVQEKKFLIPAAFVKEILIIKRDEVMMMYNRNVIRLRDMIIPVYPLSALLDEEAAPQSDKLSIVVVESMGDIIGISVDTVIQFSSMIFKPLPGKLSKLKVLQGIVFDENFEIINILFIPELINRFKGIRNIEFKERFTPEDKHYKQILVVDDSLSTREIEKSILEMGEFNVSTAVDGIDALEKLKEQYFHLILTDVRMPRMDGLTLIENVRRQTKYRNTPIIVVSSENKDELMEKVRSIGGNDLVSKKDFDRGNLLDKVRDLIG